MGRLAEAWIAPPELRQLRELIRHRAKLVHLRTSLKAQIHAVLAKEGVAVPMSDLFGVAGTRLLDTCELGDAYATRVESLGCGGPGVTTQRAGLCPRSSATRVRGGVRGPGGSASSRRSRRSHGLLVA